MFQFQTGSIRSNPDYVLNMSQAEISFNSKLVRLKETRTKILLILLLLRFNSKLVRLKVRC